MWIPAERDGQTWDFEDFKMYFKYKPTYLIVLVFITINFYLSSFITYYCHYIMSTICTNSFIIINVYECIICVSKRTEREMSWRAGATPWFPTSSSVPENFCKAHARFYSGWWINGISNHVPSLAFNILSLKNPRAIEKQQTVPSDASVCGSHWNGSPVYPKVCDSAGN